MLVANAILLIAAYVLVASWAYRRGRRMLVKCAAAFLVALVLVGLVLGLALAGPSTAMMVLFVLAIGAPIVIMPTWLLLLHHSNFDRKANTSALGPIPVAVAGAVVGFVLGYMVTIVAFPTP
jgi:hypothetical protein